MCSVRMLSLLFQLCFCLLFASAYAEETAAELELSGAKPGCQTKCGNLTIPYPFGIGMKCARSGGLNVTCNSTYDPPRPFRGRGNLEILGISSTEVRIKNRVAFRCYNRSGSNTSQNKPWTNLRNNKYLTFSNQRNIFVSVGCDYTALIQGRTSGNYTSGCLTICANKAIIPNNSCSGIGCCQASIPKGLRYYTTYLSRTGYWRPESYNISPCNYAFLADTKMFRFQASDLYDVKYRSRMNNMPVVLDWVVDNITCKDAQRNRTGFACQINTDCIDSDNGPGYRCSCKHGYEGNPYLIPGCQDTNECEDPSKHQCIHKSNCINLPGTYNCTCPQGTYGNGRKNTTGCVPESKQQRKDFPFVQVTLGLALFVLISSCWLYLDQKRRRAATLKEKFFKQNGGLLLQQHAVSSHEGGAVKLTRIYTAEELKRATNNYDESRILGRGGNGTVYKGIFPNDQTETVVAIKKSRIVDETQIEQFINEVVILTQINHRHVVRLLGCCLETEVPLLVYEFVSNGTLHEHIHNRQLSAISTRISLQNRLRIATETATALAYLHSAASIPIIHRDVKSANILLDDNYSTKVADFGASRLIPLDQTQISTLVQGTLGYLDPEYFQTSQLTEKSDVYSFGVVLVELLTGEMPFSNNRSEDRRMLVSHFILSMQDNALLQVIEEQLVAEDNKDQLFAVAELALRCLNFKREERPIMREVAGELERLGRMYEPHPWDEQNGEEATYMLGKSSDLYPLSLDPSIGDSTGQYDMNTMMSPLNLPR